MTLPGGIPQSSLEVAAALFALAAGSYIALRRAAALLVVLPLVLLVPWMVEMPALERGTLFPLAAAALWTWWLWEKEPERRQPHGGIVYWAVLSVAAILAVSLAPQTLVLTAVISFADFRERRSWRPALCLFAFPLVFLTTTLAIPAWTEGRVLNLTFWYDATVSQGWALPEWFQASGGNIFKSSLLQLNTLFYIPLLPVFAILAWRCKTAWWLKPTLIWAAVLFAGNVVFAHNVYVHLSFTMQMAVIIPSGLLGIAHIQELMCRRVRL